MGKKKPKISTKPVPNIVRTDITSKNTQLVISYKYLDLENRKYSVSQLSDNKIIIKYYEEFNTKIKEYSQYPNFKKYISEDRRYRDKNHIHPIDWKDSRIRELSFASLPPDLMEQVKDDCWQLGINNHTFRIHGFFIENVFYIVWLDFNHNLYDRK